MAITRRLIAHDENEDNQWLKVDHSSRYIANDSEEWQFLFGPDSVLSVSNKVVKIAARFDDATFNNLKLVAYIYDPSNASIGNASTCQFKFYRITTPDWTEVLINTSNGVQLSNSYFYLNPLLSSLAPIDFFGGDSLMVEATVIRLGVTYRDRIYVNHLGIFDNVTRLRQDVEFLDITKMDE